LRTHYETMGVGARADEDQIRTAYRTLAKRYHPDRHTGAPESVQRSNGQMMAALNEAYGVLSDPELRRSYDATLEAEALERSRPSAPSMRPPLDDECLLCGHYPAAEVSVQQHIGMVIVRSLRSFEGPLCRDCGLEVFRSMTARTLVTGWWGLLSFFATIAGLFGNLQAWRTLRDLDPPSLRQETILAPFRRPMPRGKPLWQRGGFVGFAVVVFLFAVPLIADSLDSSPSSPPAATRAVTGASSSSSSSSSGSAAPRSSSPRDLEGLCLRYTADSRISDVVPCSQRHDARILAVRMFPEGCPANAPYYFELPENGRNWVLCVDR
jgi:hypothetical protein